MKQKEEFWWSVALLLRLPAEFLLPLVSRAGEPVDMADSMNFSWKKIDQGMERQILMVSVQWFGL